jgi:hypothetical protein
MRFYPIIIKHLMSRSYLLTTLSRIDIFRIIRQLQTDIATLEREKVVLAATHELRKKQFHAIVAGVRELQDVIKEDREKGVSIFVFVQRWTLPPVIYKSRLSIGE